MDFRFSDPRAGESEEETGVVDIGNSLAKFREKSRVRVVCVGPDGGEKVVYSSDGVM